MIVPPGTSTLLTNIVNNNKHINKGNTQQQRKSKTITATIIRRKGRGKEQKKNIIEGSIGKRSGGTGRSRTSLRGAEVKEAEAKKNQEDY